MTKNILSVVFAAVLLLCSLLPLAGLLVAGPSGPAANEILSVPPRLRTSGGHFNEAFLNDLSDYFGDHFALRQELVTLWSQLNTALLRSSTNEQVVLGTDGWLYFADSLDDYRGRCLPEGALLDTARDLRLIREALAAEGKDFLFVIAPNKNSLYGEHMSARFVFSHEDATAVKLLPLLSTEGVSTVDLFAAFSAQDETLYYRTDSHWNARGAALAADTILAKLDKPSGYFSLPFTRVEEHRGDLYEMLYPCGGRTETDLLPESEFDFVCLNNPNGGNAISIGTEKAGGSGSLFCWRDSFGIALYPYLADSFGSAFFSRSASYDLTRRELDRCDTVILEIVERNLPQLWQSPAVYPAAAREALPAGTSDSVCAAERLPLSRGLVRWSASLPETVRDAGSELYFTAGDLWYEAAVQASVESGTVTATACLPEGVAADGLVYSSGGGLIRCAINTPSGGVA